MKNRNKNEVLKIWDLSPIIEGGEGLEKFEIDFYRKKNGNELREPYSKLITDGIFELRVKQGNNITRAFYFFVKGHKIIIMNGFIKKTEKTPINEINLAKKYREDYLFRKETGL